MLPTEAISPPLDAATPYRSLIGALSHIAKFTRPDILFATFYFARFQKKEQNLDMVRTNYLNKEEFDKKKKKHSE